MSEDIADLIDNPERLNRLGSKRLFAIDWEDIQRIQFEVMKNRFEEMRGKIRVLDRLAEDLEIDSFSSPEDATPLFLPHTMYKSYAVSNIEKNRYDKMSAWLDGLTSHELKSIDVSDCDSLESWLDTLECNSDLRPVCSSGTSGKISFFPGA